MADVYIWLRYSSSRQLTWQRNYNTQPRILSAAQERLTRTIAEAHGRSDGEAQEWVRLMLTTVGRGGDGQRIRCVGGGCRVLRLGDGGRWLGWVGCVWLLAASC